jgi:hypothetical protein
MCSQNSEIAFQAVRYEAAHKHLCHLLILSCHASCQQTFELERLSEDIALYVNIALGFVLPFIMLVVGKIRKKV